MTWASAEPAPTPAARRAVRWAVLLGAWLVTRSLLVAVGVRELPFYPKGPLAFDDLEVYARWLPDLTSGVLPTDDMWQYPPVTSLSLIHILSGFLPTGTGSLARVGHLVEAITPMGEWSPHPNVWIVAMDYDDGRRVTFGKAGAPEAPLSDAVMASCAIPAWFAPVRIEGREYVDGGTWSATNADLVAGHDLDEVYVLAPMVSFHLDRPASLLTRLERRWRLQVTKRCLHEADKVRANGANVTVVGPGPEDLEAMGGNAMDLPRRIKVLETSLRTSVQSLRDPENVGPDHMSEVG